MHIRNTQVSRSAALRRRMAAVLAALACVGVALVAPALAAAAQIPVDTAEDEPDVSLGTGNCETATGKCSLRAAIQTANEDAPGDEITFSPTVFGGASGASTIELLEALPEIKQSFEIDGGTCPTALTTEGPCAEVDGTGVAGLKSVFDVGANATTIKNLAIEGGENGVVVNAGRTGFTATGNWFGYELTTGGGLGAGGSENAGIYLDHGADGATIGGDLELDRNSFGHSYIGVVVRGASNTSIRGNYFGTIQGAFSPIAALGVGIQVGDDAETTSAAIGTQIGGELTTGEAASAACDGPCNVIVTQGGVGIELNGSTVDHLGAATGPTTIRGNYIGLGPLGTAPLGFQEADIEGAPQVGTPSTAGPGEVTIGGDGPKQRNYLIGGRATVRMRGAEALRVEGNEIGYATGHTPSEAPEEAGIQLDSTDVTEPALVRGNRINAEGANGIENEFAGAEISGNEVVGASAGIAVRGADVGTPNTIISNTLVGAAAFGIRIANDSNLIAGNAIVDAGRVGIVTFEPAEHNVIGGDLSGEANVIVKTGETTAEGEAAIIVGGRENSVNEVAANEGSLNEGPFIYLAREEPPENPPNHAIKPPVFATALQSSASGSAQANATVRIFSKASEEEGELGVLLTVVTADAAGNWSATYATQPVGGLVTATQTSTDGGTSMLAAPQKATVDPQKPSGGGTTTATPAGNPVPIAAPPPTPAKAPKVKITAGPKKSSSATTAKFKFTANPAAGAKFECKLDNAKWAKCSSPKAYKKLKAGKHTFRVRAIASGVTGAVVTFKFTVTS